jgi:hypothetical protein
MALFAAVRGLRYTELDEFITYAALTRDLIYTVSFWRHPVGPALAWFMLVEQRRWLRLPKRRTFSEIDRRRCPCAAPAAARRLCHELGARPPLDSRPSDKTGADLDKRSTEAFLILYLHSRGGVFAEVQRLVRPGGRVRHPGLLQAFYVRHAVPPIQASQSWHHGERPAPDWPELCPQLWNRRNQAPRPSA